MQTGGYQVIGLREAVARIQRAVKQRMRDERYPYFFIAGSGVSLPAMPTTQRIIEDCKRKPGAAPPPNDVTLSESYSYWLESAHSEPIERQRYFASLVRKAKVNAASLFLAQLLVGSDIARVVVTTNFDDLLRRALRLLGASPRILDYPDSVARLDLQSDEIQVAQVHGSHHYYDLKNLHVELESLKRPEAAGPARIVFQLERLLEFSSPIVIGYGGWQHDVVMTALERFLRERSLRRNLYWFLYDKHELPNLPEWLQRNPQVYFVVADSPRAIPAAPSVSSVSETDAPGGILSTDPIIETMDAGRALHELVSALKVPVPRIINNPIGHFAKQIETTIGTDLDQYENYRFRDVAKRLRHAERLEQQYPEDLDPLARVAKFARENKVAELVAQIESMDYHESWITPEQYEEMLTALEGALETSQMPRELKLRGLKLFFGALLGYSAKSDALQGKKVFTPRQQARKAMKAAREIEELGEFDAAVAAYGSVINTFSHSTSRPVLAYVVEAQGLRALVLSRRLRRHDEAVALLEAFIARGAYFSEGYELRLAVLSLRFAYSEVLARAGRDPLPVLERIIVEYTDAVTGSNDDVSDVSFVTKSVRAVAEALIRKAVHLFSQKNPADELRAIESYQEVIRYAASRPAIARQAARAYRELAFIKLKSGNARDVANIATEGIAYLDATTGLRPAHEGLYRVQLTYLKANAVRSLGEIDEAIQLYSEIAAQPTLAGLPGEEYGSSIARLVEHGIDMSDRALVKRYVPALTAIARAAGDNAPSWWSDVLARAGDLE